MLYSEVMDFLDKTTWLPETFKIAGYISLMSFIARRNFSLSYSLRTYLPNTYVMVVGESGSGKGVILDDFLRKIIFRVDNRALLPTLTTPEKMISLMAKYPLRSWINDEISTVITRKKYMEDIVDILNLMYNSHLPEIRMSRMKKEYVVRNPTLSVAFGTQPNTLSRLINRHNIMSGFIPRFMMFYGERQQQKHVSKEDISQISGIVSDYYAQTVRMGDFIIDLVLENEALKWYLNTCSRIKDKMDEDTLPYFARVNDHIAKLILLITSDMLLEAHIPLSLIQKSKNAVENDKSDTNNNVYDNVSYVSNVVTVTIDEYINIKCQPIMDTYMTEETWYTEETLYKNINLSEITAIIDKILLLYQNSILDMLDKELTVDTYILKKYITAIKRCISKGLIDSEDDNFYYIRRRDILRLSKTTLKKLSPYEQTLKELGIIYDIIRKDRKWLWKVDKKEIERFS